MRIASCRLWLATGYKMWELDLLLGAPAVGNGRLDQQALAALLCFRQLQDATGLAVDQQLAFYQDIDTATHRDPDGTTTVSLYAQIFLNTAVTSVAPDPDLAALPTGGTIADPILNDHLAGIQAALGVTAADAATLFGLTDNRLTLANLSLIYRVTALASGVEVAGFRPPGPGPPAQSRLHADLPRRARHLSPSATRLPGTELPRQRPGSCGRRSRTGNTTWTVVRGQQGTTPAPADATS